MGYSQYKVSGEIVDYNNLPLEYAKVIIQTLDSVSIKSETTNNDGKFIFTNINNGTYELIINYFSVNIHSQIIKIEEDLELQNIYVDVNMKLEEIVVTAETNLKKEVGKYVITNISSSKFSKNKTTYEFLSTVPLIETSADGSTIKIRGKGDAIISINGKSVGGNDIALSMIRSIPATDIKKIEIIKSPNSKYAASNNNGIINIILKNKEDEGFKGVLSSGIAQSYYNSQNLNSYFSFSKNKVLITSGVVFDNFNYKHKSNYIYDDYINNMQTTINSNSNNKNKSIIPYVNVNYNINNKQTLGIQVNSKFNHIETISTTDNIYNIINNPSADSINTAIIKEKTPNNMSVFGNINYSIKTDDLGSNFELSLGLYNNKNDKNSFNTFRYVNNNHNDFLQNPNIRTKVGNVKADFSKIFTNEDKMNIGVLFIRSDIGNNFFFGYFDGAEYISDIRQSNKFEYKDYTLAAYISYEKIICDELESEIALRLERFDSKGKTNTNPNINNLTNTYLFPSFSLLFTPTDNHEFSLDLGSSIIRPWYNNLNPFVSYTSPTSYKISNPNLLPTVSYELLFNYTFFDDFSFDFEYVFDKDLFNDFDVVLANGDIQTTTDNYGNGNNYCWYLTYSKKFINNKWNFSSSFSYDYSDTKASYNGVNLDFKNSSYNFRIRNNVILNRKQDMILSLNYGYNSGYTSILGNRNALHSFTFDLSKSFDNFYVSIGAYDLARTDLELREKRNNYGFYKKIEYYKTYNLTIRYTFGNNKVKRVYDKENEINKRLL